MMQSGSEGRAVLKEGVKNTMLNLIARTCLIMLILVFVVPLPHLLAMTQILPDATVEEIPNASRNSSEPSIVRKKPSGPTTSTR